MSDKAMYTQEQLDAELLKHNQGDLSSILERIEAKFDKIERKIDSHFCWMVGLMLGLYAMGTTGLIGALGHSHGWF